MRSGAVGCGVDRWKWKGDQEQKAGVAFGQANLTVDEWLLVEKIAQLGEAAAEEQRKALFFEWLDQAGPFAERMQRAEALHGAMRRVEDALISGLEARLADDESAAALAACSCAELAADARARLEEASRGGDSGGAPSSKLEALAAGATRALARQQEELKGHRRRLEETARALREEAHRFEAEEQEAPAAACLAAADACDGSAARLLPLLKGLLEQLLLVETRVAELAADADLRLCGCAAAGAGAGAGALPELEPAAAIQALADREWRLANRAAALQNLSREEQEEACLLQWSGHVEGAKKCVAIAEACRERLLATQDLISRVQERRAALEGQQLALGVEEDLRCAAEEQARAARQPEPLTFATTRGRGWAAVSMWVTRTLLEEREQQLVARVQQLDGSARDEHKKAARLERRQKARCAVECAKRGDAYRAQQGRFERLLARVLEQKARLGA